MGGSEQGLRGVPETIPVAIWPEIRTMLLSESPEPVILEPDPADWPGRPVSLQPRSFMRTRISAGLVVLAAGLVSMSTTPLASGQAKTGPKLLYGHDLQVRPGGEKEFAKAAKIGVEWFQAEVDAGDTDSPKLIPYTIGISETGFVGVYPGGPVGTDKKCKWVAAHDLSVRKSGEKDFTQKTKMFGVEVNRDLGTNELIYTAESGSIAFAPVPGNLATEKGPKWHHALEAKVRGLEESTFENAKAVGLEVFRDENTGGLIYITENGAIATAAAPATAPDPKKPLPPKSLYGLILKARAAGETEFTASTKRIGLEVFEDPNANTLLYITSTGAIAVIPNPGTLATVEPKKAVTWKPGLNLSVRKAGDKDFEKAKKYAVEIYRDNRTGAMIFLAETGSIAVLPK